MIQTLPIDNRADSRAGWPPIMTQSRSAGCSLNGEDRLMTDGFTISMQWRKRCVSVESTAR